MDGRDGMGLSAGSASFYMHTGLTGSGGGSGPQTGFHAPPGFRPLSNPNFSIQSNVRTTTAAPTFSVEPSQPNHGHGRHGHSHGHGHEHGHGHGFNMGVSPAGMSTGDPAKKKRGRPRKYGPEGQVSLGLSPMSSTPSTGSITPVPKRGRGRPPGSGRRQQLAVLGGWMSDSAGLAFTPHVITILPTEDIVEKILSFSQQRGRAVCVLSGTGAVSSVTLCHPGTSTGNIRYEGRFQILCLSGSYLASENGGPRSRTGGLSVSLASSEGHVIGGGIGALIAASPVQVVASSFVYGGSKTKSKEETVLDVSEKPSNKSNTPTSAPPQHMSHHSAAGNWSGSRALDLRNPNTEIDLTRG
ncbi:PPC domain [Dillenia turbinata]|uniref:AT-hook motif nuclear-localized protein n=1 Tax=Dillenia turbinata TaxID=194707 RepID=A0AAN8VHX4_9MAGN